MCAVDPLTPRPVVTLALPHHTTVSSVRLLYWQKPNVTSLPESANTTTTTCRSPEAAPAPDTLTPAAHTPANTTTSTVTHTPANTTTSTVTHTPANTTSHTLAHTSTYTTSPTPAHTTSSTTTNAACPTAVCTIPPTGAHEAAYKTSQAAYTTSPASYIASTTVSNTCTTAHLASYTTSSTSTCKTLAASALATFVTACQSHVWDCSDQQQSPTSLASLECDRQWREECQGQGGQCYHPVPEKRAKVKWTASVVSEEERKVKQYFSSCGNLGLVSTQEEPHLSTVHLEKRFLITKRDLQQMPGGGVCGLLLTKPQYSCTSDNIIHLGMCRAYIGGGTVKKQSLTNLDCNNNFSEAKRFPHRRRREITYHTRSEKDIHVSVSPAVRLQNLLGCRLWGGTPMIQGCPLPTSPVSKVTAKVKNLFRKVKSSGRQHRFKWSSFHSPFSTTQSNAVEGVCGQTSGESVEDGGGVGRGKGEGQQRGDSSTDSRGRPWWANPSRNDEGGQNSSHCKAKQGDDKPATNARTPIAPASATTLRRSFDTDSVIQKKKNKTSQGLRRSASIDQDRRDNTYFSMCKYRDKHPNRRSKADLSSSSEDPPTGAASSRTKPRSSKSSSERKRPSSSQRGNNDHGRSRRRHSKKVEHSSSSLSSSPSRSASATRTRTPLATTPGTPHRVNTSRVTSGPTAATDVLDPLEGNSKDNTKEFLQRLDNVLTDLVESEKKKISSYGHMGEDETTRPESKTSSVTGKIKCHKHKKVSKEKEQAECKEEEVSPALQQLRATLKSVRVRKRVPPTGDVLDRHSQFFTQRQAHNPRILRSQRASHLITQRYYQPPKRRPPRPRPNANSYHSDFCSSDEDQPKVGQGITGMGSREQQEAGSGNGHKEDEEDTCYGSDYPGSQPPPPRRLTQDPSHLTQRLLEAADSGEYSIDSAYTGSRGATPESILYPGVKPRRQGGSLTTPPLVVRPHQPRPPRSLPQAERLQQLKKTILHEIREGGLYSDESINLLLEQYRRRCCHFSTADLDLVTKSIQEDLGVKPKPSEYLYQLLVAAEDDHSQADQSKGICETEDMSLLTLRSTGKTYEYQRQREAGGPGLAENPSYRSRTSTRHSPIKPPRSKPTRSSQEAEDEAWVKSVVGEVAPQLVAEVRQEVQRRPEDATDPDWSHYVTELCQKFEIKI